MPYVYIVTENLRDYRDLYEREEDYQADWLSLSKRQRYILSDPIPNLETAAKCAKVIATRLYGTINPETGIFSCLPSDIQSNSQVIKLNIPVETYKQWKEEHPGSLDKETLNVFMSMNNRPLKIVEDIARVRAKSACISSGIRSPDSFFNKLAGDAGPSLGGMIAAFSTKAKVLSGEELEKIAAKYIEQRITP